MTLKVTDPIVRVRKGNTVLYEGVSENQALATAGSAEEGTYEMSWSDTEVQVGEDDPDPGPGPGPEPGESLIEQEAATMQVGEWRNLIDKTNWEGKDDGVSFKQFQVVYNEDGDPITDGMGWTQDIAYHNGKLIMLLMRSNWPDLMVMEPEGEFWKLMQVPDVYGGGRRPFNRLAWDDEYLYYFPAQIERVDTGKGVRTPLANPGVFEDIFPNGFGSSQQDSSGNFAVTYVPEWGRFYSYAQQGYIRSIAIGETQWTVHGQTPEGADGRRANGYAGILVWNPHRKELAIMGSQHFGDNPAVGDKWCIMTEPYGEIQAMPDLVADGESMQITSAMDKLFYRPTGEWILQSDQYRMFTSPDGIQPWTLYEDLREVGLPLGRYETYAPIYPVPGFEDVYVFLQNIEGLVLHRLKALS